MTLHLIVGPMFSGKTTRLVSLLREAQSRRLNLVAVKPRVDNRYAPRAIVSHDGQRWPAKGVTSAAELIRMAEGATMIAVDEAQFFSLEISSALKSLSDGGAAVTVAALDRDFRGERFSTTSAILELATSVEPLTASCGLCGRAAEFSQRLIDGAPASVDDPTVVIGGAETYQPRCARCFWKEREPR